MKNCLNKNLHRTFIVCVILLTGALVGCGEDHKDHDHNKMNKSKTHSKSAIVHEGIIHVSVIRTKMVKFFRIQWTGMLFLMTQGNAHYVI